MFITLFQGETLPAENGFPLHFFIKKVGWNMATKENEVTSRYAIYEKIAYCCVSYVFCASTRDQDAMGRTRRVFYQRPEVIS